MIGVVSGSLVHSVVTPCTKLVGASPGIFALLGAAVVKIKRHNKYKGQRRRMFNLLLSVFTFAFAVINLGFSIHAWRICDKAVKNTPISAHVVGFIAGLAVGYIVLNKYQEPVEPEGRGFYTRIRPSGRFTDITPEDVRCDVRCNIANFYEAYIRNLGPSLLRSISRKLFRGQSTLLFTSKFL